MPEVQSSFYPKQRLFKNAHASTIYANLLRVSPRIPFNRERIATSDKDFLDLDWSRVGSKKLIFILAGLEGKSNSPYSKSATRYFNNHGWDAVCMNYRGCSGEPNKLLNGYHMGATGDVKESIEHIIVNYDYQDILLIGYSLGGNIALKYAGEEGSTIPKEIKGTVNFSVPMAISKSNKRLNHWYNWHYKKWFMIPLNYKANQKKKQFPKALKSYRGFFMTGDFIYFDTHYTAPANGYKSVEEYWKKSSCKPFLNQIKIPSLVVSAHNDTFISKDCFPIKESKSNPLLFLEMPEHGGHCGFIQKLNESHSWMEERALGFIQSHLQISKNEDNLADINVSL